MAQPPIGSIIKNLIRIERKGNASFVISMVIMQECPDPKQERKLNFNKLNVASDKPKLFVAALSTTLGHEKEWYLDSGATDHLHQIKVDF